MHLSLFDENLKTLKDVMLENTCNTRPRYALPKGQPFFVPTFMDNK